MAKHEETSDRTTRSTPAHFTKSEADKLREDADRKADEARKAQDAADKAKAEAEASAPPKSPMERALRKKRERFSAGPDSERKEQVVINAANVSFAPAPLVPPSFDPNKSERQNEQTKLARGEYAFACQTIMKQAGVTQEQAEDIIEEMDQTQANDLVDAANGNRIDHIGRILAGQTETDEARIKRIQEEAKKHADGAKAAKS